MQSKTRVIFGLALTLFIWDVPAQSLVVFNSNFEGAMPAQFAPGVATLTGVQGYAGLGPTGNQFGGSFLRSPTGNSVTLTLSNLPPHTALTVSFLFAAIDSLDGTGTYPSGDFFLVKLGTSGGDLQQVFRESFANALDNQVQSYVAPPGGELARKVDLGFSGPGGFYRDSAYNFGVDPNFMTLAHTGSVAVFTFLMEGPGIQPLDDESWAMDNLTVSLTGAPVPVITRLEVANGALELEWSAQSNLTYGVQTTTNLVNPVWVDSLPPVLATANSASATNPFPDASRFFRVRVMSP